MSFALRAASRSLATFCWGVSLGGGVEVGKGIVEEDAFDWAFGCVDVKRVASYGVRGMSEETEMDSVVGLFSNLLSSWSYTEQAHN